ncbi:hypothetical protein B0H13DRAFT_2381503 [Mycena leptocephala]|nr:hypothetical protein B0H13DRAFT_2381503 [Mycena leptocephala]
MSTPSDIPPRLNTTLLPAPSNSVPSRRPTAANSTSKPSSGSRPPETASALSTPEPTSSTRAICWRRRSLLDANSGTTAIADSLLTGEQPAPADSNAKIVAGLQAALGSLSHVDVVLIFNNDTKTAVAAANSSVTSALAAAQSAVAANCQTTL